MNSVRSLFATDFLGLDEIAAISARMGIRPITAELPPVPETFLEAARQSPGEYLLLLGTESMADGSPMTLNALRQRFGLDPAVSEPCFYNQDWYIKEAFAGTPCLDQRWYLLRKSIKSASRGRSPDDIIRELPSRFMLPPVLLCAYAFFAYYFHTGGKKLWDTDYVWCSDLDSQGDRIYAGRYHDPSGISKNGFSVHRHLRIRKCYGLADLAR